MKKMKITAIIVTYDRPDALESILLSLTGQCVKPDEVIIADDGSGPDTEALIRSFINTVPFELKHIRQEKEGFRAAAIRNKAILQSTGDYLVFSDGDLVFHPSFIYDFKQRMAHGTACIGSRVFLTAGASEKIMRERCNEVKIPFWSQEIETNRLNGIRCPLASRLYPPVLYSGKLRGGLLGVSKSDLVSVNGWNESFRGWGLEDTELVLRLFNRGICLRKLKFSAISYHLWHPTASRELLGENRRLLQNCLEKRLTWCSNGLVKGERP